MPHTMPKEPTHRTGKPNAVQFRAGRLKADPGFMPPHLPGETGRQLANRLREEAAAFAAEIADKARVEAETAPKPKRKPRAKKVAAE